MQMSLPCLLFVAGNLISSCVATIQTGGMLRMLLMTHTQTEETDRKTFHFTSFNLLPLRKGQSLAAFFFGI